MGTENTANTDPNARTDEDKVREAMEKVYPASVKSLIKKPFGTDADRARNRFILKTQGYYG